jgi:hypothetical protein
MAAVAAARKGRRVVVADYARHVGGMSASGLSKSDVQNRGAVRGLFLEFTERVRAHYESVYGPDSEAARLSQNGYYYEPSVAEKIFRQLMAETGLVTLLLGRAIQGCRSLGTGHEVELGVRSGEESESVEVDILIDASYEGDLYAAVGAEYRIGREGRSEYGEPHAGRIFLDYESFEILDGSTGEGDDRLQAYTYRLCLTDDPDNSVPLTKAPTGYDRACYLGYLEDLHAGRLGPPKTYREGHGYYAPHFNTIMRAFSFTPIPNRKYDVNINPRPIAFPFPGENRGYADANWAERERICLRHRELTLGLLYFAQNDPAIPADQRALARRYHLPKDEFVEEGHFPWQLYVREARRLKGLYTITELDVSIDTSTKRTKIHPDSVATGEFPIDSFPVTKKPSSGGEVLEGYIGVLEEATSPYQIPLRAILPDAVDGIIVPVAASATHVAFSTLRMEPLWMVLGQAAGIAAELSLAASCHPRELPIARLQRRLLEGGVVIAYFDDLDPSHPNYDAVQYWAARGFFSSYLARPDSPVTSELLERWIARAGESFSAEQRPIDIDEVPRPVEDDAGGDGRVSRKELQRVLRDRFPAAANGGSVDKSEITDGSPPFGDSSSDEPVTRAELCAALYEIGAAIS